VTEPRRATVRDYMTRQIVTVAPDMEVLAAMQRLLDARVSGAPVVDAHGNLVGMLTQRDCLDVATHAVYHGEPAGRVSDYMNAPVTTLSAGTSLIDGIEAFRHSRFRRFPVLDGTRLVGLLSRRDVVRAILEFA
jgi:CBS domain-containing protein